MSSPLPNSTPHRFAIVITACNQGRTVSQVVRKALKWLLPVIIVDDGSTDDTFLRIQSAPDIQLIRHPFRKGKGAALVTGMTAAAKIANWAICLDADGRHDPEEIAAFVKAARKQPRGILIGKRSSLASGSWTNRLGHKFCNFWVRASGGPLIADAQSGFRMYPIPEALQLNVKTGRRQYEMEILTRAHWNGIPTMEVPIHTPCHVKAPDISRFEQWRNFYRNAATFSRLIFLRLFTPSHWFKQRAR